MQLTTVSEITFAPMENVTIDKMKNFIGPIFSMGLISMPLYKKYWSKVLLFKNKHFTLVLPREHFESILRFNFGEKPLFENNSLSKLRMILVPLNQVMVNIITSKKKLSINEPMMLWRGCIVFGQCTKNKRYKYGIMFYEVCTYDGLVLTVETWWSMIQRPAQSAAIVLKLVNPFLNKG